MFSGIVEEIGRVTGREELADGVRLTIAGTQTLSETQPGDSICVSGVCQTVVRREQASAVFEAVGETMVKTSLGRLVVGDRVNLERPLRLGDRLDGHMVQGHVNATAVVRGWSDHTRYLEIAVPEHLLRYIVLEGSLTVDGVSLTVARLIADRVSFSIVPYTAAHTALTDRAKGNLVNIEVDMVAKYVEQQHLHGGEHVADVSPTQPSATDRGGDDESDKATAAVEAVVAAFRVGRIAIVTDDEERENEGDLVAFAASTTADTVNFMVTHGRGLLCAPLPAERAAALSLDQMTASNSALHGTAFTVSVDARSGTTTGVSAADRAATVRALADAATAPRELARPGHVFPLVAEPGGVLARRGHTEAVVELCRLAGGPAVGVLCEIMDADGSMAREPALRELATTHALPTVSIAQVSAYLQRGRQLSIAGSLAQETG